MNQLPSELVQAIIKQLDDKRDLASLCLVSGSFYKETAPVLREYKPLQIVFPDERELHKVPGNVLVDLQGQQLSYFHRARNVQLRAPSFKIETERCYHHTAGNFDPLNGKGADLKLEDLSEDDKRDWPSRLLARDLLPTLKLIHKNQLTHFTYAITLSASYKANRSSWELGCCIPREIMGGEGWLGTSQSHIQSLKVITAGGCDFSLSNPGERFNVSLTSFRRLTALTWIGLKEHTVADQVALALTHNALHLEHLELDFVCLNPHYRDDRATHFTASSFLGSIDSTMWGPRFPTLQKISLSNVSLGDVEEFISTVNWKTVAHLCLRGCSGTRNFLCALTESYFTLHLKTFEISVEYRDANASERYTMICFLKSFSGLENLYMHMEASLTGCGDSIWCAIANNHGSTLRRFVYQAVCWEDNGIIEYAMPISCLGVDDEETLDNIRRYNPLSSLNLECLGLAARPDILMNVLGAFVGKDLQLLHIRIPSGEFTRALAARELEAMRDAARLNASRTSIADYSDNEVLRLLDWLFNEEGITSLHTVVFGDFTTRGRYQDSAFVIKRSQGPFRWKLYEFEDSFGSQGSSDVAIDRLVEKHLEFLESAPRNGLLRLD